MLVHDLDPSLLTFFIKSSDSRHDLHSFSTRRSSDLRPSWRAFGALENQNGFRRARLSGARRAPRQRPGLARLRRTAGQQAHTSAVESSRHHGCWRLSNWLQVLTLHSEGYTPKTLRTK